MTPDKQKKRILFLVQLPPPLHGVSLLNQYAWENRELLTNSTSKLLQLKFSHSIHELRKFRPGKLFSMARILVQLIYTLITFRPHLVYFSIMPVGAGFIRDLLFVALLKLSGTKLTYHLHNQGISEAVAKRAWLGPIYRWVFSDTLVIHLSRGLLKKEIIPLKARNCHTVVVHNGTGPAETDHPRLKQEKHTPEILFLSHITPEKGLDTLIQALAILRSNDPQISWKLHIAGDFYSRKYYQHLIVLIESLNLQNHILFHGDVDASSRMSLFRVADLFVFPSQNDTLGIAVLEAMQSGLPCIATTSGALPEYFPDDRACLFVPPKNETELAGAIRRLLLKQELANNLAAEGKKAASQYTKAKFVSELTWSLNSFLSSGKS